MNVLNNFGFLPHLNASLEMFEEYSKGKARTELTLQGMDDGDIIVCMGSQNAKQLEARMRDLGMSGCMAVYLPMESGVSFVGQITNICQRHGHGRKVHLDHDVMFMLAKEHLKFLSHEIARLAEVVGGHNLQAPDIEPRHGQLRGGKPRGFA